MVPELNPFFFANRASGKGGLKIANRRFEAIRANLLKRYENRGSARTLPYQKYYGHINSLHWWQNTTTVVKHYGRVSETPCFPRENSQEVSSDSELLR